MCTMSPSASLKLVSSVDPHSSAMASVESIADDVVEFLINDSVAEKEVAFFLCRPAGLQTGGYLAHYRSG